MNCTKCSNKLTEEELKFFNENVLLRITNNYLCKLHWCECMPDATPWKWLNTCSICDKGICNACKNYTINNNNTICSDCYVCLINNRRI